MKLEFEPYVYNRSRDEYGEYYGGSVLDRFEKALRDGKTTMPEPLWEGRTVEHLHFRHMKGEWWWVLTTQRSRVCKTPRCVPVKIEKLNFN